MTFDLILVPVGAEYRAVKHGNCDRELPVLPISLGTKNVTKFLNSKQFKDLHPKKVLIMGLCGSLSDNYSVGDIVIYKNCYYPNKDNLLYTDSSLTEAINQKIGNSVSLVTSLTSDRIVYQIQQKQKLYKTYKTQVVDMEGFAYLKLLQEKNIACAILRVVSDDIDRDIPNLNNCLDLDSTSLDIQKTIVAIIKNPIRGIRLITGSLQGLRVLTKLAKILTSN